MIATSSPKAATTSSQPKIPMANPSILPSGSIHDYKFTSGPYAGMTYQQVVEYLKGYSQSVQQASGNEPPKNNQTQQALGLLGGLGGAALVSNVIKNPAGIGNAVSGLGSIFGGGSATGASTAGASTAGSGLGGMQLSGSLGTAGAADLSAGGAAAAPGAGFAGALAPAAGIAAGAGVGYLQGKGLYDAAKGEDLDFKSQAALALPTFGASFLYNPAKKLFGWGGNKDKKERTRGRAQFNQAGLFDKGNYLLPDGSQFGIADFKKRTGQDAYKIDRTNADAGIDDRVSQVDALTNALIGGGGSRLRADMTGEMYNALMSGGDFNTNLKGTFDKLGGRDAVYGQVAQNWEKSKGKMSARERDVAFANIDKLYGVKNTNNSRWDSQLTGELADRNAKENSKWEQNAAKVSAETKLQAPTADTPKANKPQVQVVKPANPRLKKK